MKLIWENRGTFEGLSEKQLRRKLSTRKGGEPSFVILEREDGSYVQAIGGGVACCLEWRDRDRHRHLRAFLDPPKVPWTEPAILNGVTLGPSEFLFIEDVVECFAAFQAGKSSQTTSSGVTSQPNLRVREYYALEPRRKILEAPSNNALQLTSGAARMDAARS